MKFGKTFLNHQIPEWSIFYMNYKHLKKIIKTIDAVYDSSIDTDASEVISSVLSSFFFELDRDIEKVSEFYNNKFKEYNRRLDRLIQVLGYSNSAINHQVESNEELDEIISILLELRSIYRNLKWFGELNHKGFVKILKKLDKKLNLTIKNLETDNLTDTDKFSFELSSNNKETYLSTRVEALPFANGSELLTSLDIINDILNKMSDEEDFNTETDQAAKNFEFLKIGNRRRYSFDQEFLQHYYELIYQNSHETLLAELSSITDKSKLTLKFLISLLSKAAMVNSGDCIDVLFDYLTSYVSEDPVYENNPLYDKSDISGRNFFHQYITSLGKNQVIKKQKVTPGESADMDRFFGNKNGPDGGNQISISSIEGFKHILGRLIDPKLRSVLLAHDNYNRTPLHYCAQYGLKDATKILLDVLKKWELVDPNVSVDNVGVWGDQEGLTPLHLSIIGKHPKTTENLILANNGNTLCCPQLLLLAVRLNNPLILNSLITQGRIDIDYTDLEHNNETALYVASKLMLYNLVEFLLENGANTELGENVFGWTPIFIAAAEGDKAIVKLLIEFGAKFDIFDYSGWLPMEHASLRGHLEVADLLRPQDVNLLLYDVNHPENNLPRTNGVVSPTPVGGRPAMSPMETSESINRKSVSPDIESSIDRLPESTKKSVNEVYKQLKGNGSSSSIISRSKSPGARHRARNVKPIKSFGHRYLDSEESLILITLGTTDLRDHSKPIDLNKITLAKTFFTELDTALSLKITCRDKTNNAPVEPPVIIDLPLEDQHGSATDPITFKLSNGLDSNDVIITFDLIPTYQYTTKKEKILGRAIALLKDAYTKVGPHLRSLNNSITLPILDSSSLDILGNLRFEYLCVKSFNHSSMSIARSDTYWKQLVSTRVIGHRGLGKNVSTRNSLQLGENTVESFIAAASLGASYVEFDVQLTKDFIPVVYHDFTVAESGVDIPMHALTVEQFLGLKDDEKHHKSSHRNPNTTQDDEVVHKVNRPRSLSSFPSAPNFQNKSKSHTQFSTSLSSTAEDERIEREYRDQVDRKMRLTKTWKNKGFKGNARGMSVASNFVTLKELFKKLPKSIGFNIELKYPMLDEAEEESMGEIGIDLNFYVDTILKVIYDENTAARDIIFSSFHPDVCLLLSLKQPTIPILFLTEAGTAERADIRSSSLQNAIRFSKKWNLLGIVSAAETLVKTPRLTQVVKSSGLVCVTYGTDNNDPELAKIQMKAGVDAVIADSVLAVREGLRKDQESLKELEDSASD